jgi:carboxyl-terminal processing protease
MPLKNIVTIAVAVLVSLACYSAVTKSRHANLYAEAVDIINREALNEHDDEELFARSVGGLLSEDDDPYFSFLRNRGYEQLIEMLYQEFAGVGVYYDFDFEREEVFVLAPVPNGPADEAGLLPGDIFRKIDGQAVRFDRESSGVESLRGPEGTSVVVTIERDGNLRDFSVNRKKIQIQTVHGDWMSADGVWEFVLKDSPEIGYLNILDFGYETTEEVGDALDQISEKIDGLIIDLRRNGGGPLDAAVNVCDMFLPEGRLIVETRGRGGVIREQRFSTAKQRLSDEIPIAILTDRNTASASEIVAACLQDHHRAVIIGERTFGKGTVQDVVTLQPKRSALKLTTASYWRPSNRNIDRRTSEQAAKRDPKPMYGASFLILE